MQKKKGWFSRRKKLSGGSTPATVSRPPSGASFGSSLRKPASKSDSLEDELPPRTNGDAARSSTDLPKHAGFDLSAIKEIIGKAELNPDEFKVQTVPPVLPPTHRSESAPPPTMKSSAKLALDPASSTQPLQELSHTFQRSMSINDLHEEPENVRPLTHAQQSQPVHQDAFESASYSTPPSPPLPSIPSIGGFNSTWAVDPLAKNVPQEFESRSVGPLTDVISLGNPDGTNTPFSSWYTPSRDPFTDISSSSTDLSFGSTDGSITFSPATEAEQDPWNSRLPQTKVGGYNSNPWQS